MDASYGRSELRPRNTRRARAIEHPGTGGAELQLASDKAGDDAVVIGNILLAKPHDIRRTGCLILLGLGECRTGAYDQCSNDKSELFHISS